MTDTNQNLKLLLEPFRNYLLVDHIVDGGMGAIFRAKYLDSEINKVVTIKMIKEKFSLDPEFKKLFLNEIKVTFPLVHPNIAQTYEYGEHDGKLFTIMEYVDGKNLKEYLARLKNLGFAFPVEVAMYITAEICKGLHYAHTLTDNLTGKSQNIIHRDISPHNVMLTYDGTVKVIDFGIAKADSNADKTKTGIIKGKLSYMAPEYLAGEDIDQTYDQFATAVVLWEMLCSRPLFRGKNEMEKMMKIHECKVDPPSSINPKVPKELDAIILQALSKNPKKRFPTMEHFNRALIKCLYTNFPNFSPTDLGLFGPKLFKKEIELDRLKFQVLQEEIADQIVADSSKYEISNEEEKELTESKLEVAELLRKSEEEKRKQEEIKKASDELIKEEVIVEEQIPTLPEIEAEEEEEDQIEVPVESVDEEAEEESDDKGEVENEDDEEGEDDEDEENDEEDEEGAQDKNALYFKYGVIAASILVVLVGGYRLISSGEKEKIPSLGQNKVVDTNAPIPKQIKKQTRKIKIKLNGFRADVQKLFLNGEPTRLNFLGELTIDADSEVILRIERKGYRHIVHRFNFSNNENIKNDDVINFNVPEPIAEGFGYVFMSSPCLQGKLNFTLYTENRSQRLPLKNDYPEIAFPLGVNDDGYSVASEYQLTYISDNGKEEKSQLKIERDFQRIDLCTIFKN